MSDLRYLVSLLLALLLCVGLWFAVPYNNFVINNSFISDSYLPELVVLTMTLMALVVNPLLRKLSPGYALEHKHLALICGVLLFAAILPSNGLMRFMPHTIAKVNEQINASPQLGPAIADSALPAALFPDAVGYDVPTPVSSQLMDELEENQSIPWGAWLVPAIAWGVLIIAFWVLMIGMGLMFFPQWMYVERLAFPLLRVYHALISNPEPGKAWPPVFYNRLFWVGTLVVLFIHSTNGLAIFTDGAVPAIPIQWNLSPYLTDGVFANMPGFLKTSRLYFLFIGLAYFIPNRYSFSIWFTILAVGIITMMAAVYTPTFKTTSWYDQGTGAIIAMAVGVLWLGRSHYGRVFLAAIGRHAGGQEDKTNALAGRMFLGGGVVMFGWFIWAGAGLFWALVFMAVAIIIMLVVSRIVAETGITYIWIIPLTLGRIVDVLPSKWLTVPAAFLQEMNYLIINRASALSAATITILALGLSPKSSQPSRRRMAGLGVVVLVLGLGVCGAVHLDMGYRFAESLDGVNMPITGRGAQLVNLNSVSVVLSGRDTALDAQQASWIIWGVGLSGVLLYLCGRFPWWPLHPMGLIFVYSSIGLRLFMSLFIGWLIKSLLVRYGGAAAYKAAMPMFLGLIVGEIMANALWALGPVIQILMGVDPENVDRLIIFQYT